MMKPLSFYYGFIFDFDGVLADSVEVKTAAFATIFEKFGPEIQAKVVDHHRNNGGMTRGDKFAYYHRNFLRKPLDQGEMTALSRSFSNLVVDGVVASPEIPGAGEFLKKFQNKAKCFVVSATPDEEIRWIVQRRGIYKYFDEILGSSSSKIEHLNYLIEKYNLNPGECLFFGDAGSDHRAAIQTGVDFVGILPDSKAPLLKIAPEIQWYKNFTSLLEAD